MEEGSSCDSKERNGVRCDDDRYPTSNARLVVRSKHSSLWFFDGKTTASWLPAARRREEREEEPAAAARREVEATASAQGAAEGRSCGLPSVTDWQVQEMSAYEAGRRLSAIDLLLPLPLMQSG